MSPKVLSAVLIPNPPTHWSVPPSMPGLLPRPWGHAPHGPHRPDTPSERPPHPPRRDDAKGAPQGLACPVPEALSPSPHDASALWLYKPVLEAMKRAQHPEEAPFLKVTVPGRFGFHATVLVKPDPLEPWAKEALSGKAGPAHAMSEKVRDRLILGQARQFYEKIGQMTAMGDKPDHLAGKALDVRLVVPGRQADGRLESRETRLA